MLDYYFLSFLNISTLKIFVLQAVDLFIKPKKNFFKDLPFKFAMNFLFVYLTYRFSRQHFKGIYILA